MAYRILSLALTLSAGLAFAQDGATCRYGDFLFHPTEAGMEICQAPTQMSSCRNTSMTDRKECRSLIGEKAFYGSLFETVVISSSIRKIGSLHGDV